MNKHMKELITKEELEVVAEIILKNNFRSIGVQLPDNALPYSLEISNVLKKKLRSKEEQIVENHEREEEDSKKEIKKNEIEEEKEKERNIYILGDTSLNECCEDFVNADHMKADFLIHFGLSCQSFIIPYIPSIYLFNKISINDSFFFSIKKCIEDYKTDQENVNNCILLLFDVSYQSVTNQIVSYFIKQDEWEHDNVDTKEEREEEVVVQVCSNIDHSNVKRTNLIVGIHKIINSLNGKMYYGFWDNFLTLNVQESVEDQFHFCCGRILCQVYIDKNRKKLIYNVLSKEERVLFSESNLFLFPNNNEHFLHRIILEVGGNCKHVYIYEEEKKDFSKKNPVDSILLKRYSLIEQCKKVEVFGILIGNVNLYKGREMRRVINTILRKKEKKCFTIVTNKMNSPKLENFHDIEMYILINCPEYSLLQLKDFSKKIITPYEFLVAYDYIPWSVTYEFEFYKLLKIDSIKEELEDTHKKSKYKFWKAEDHDVPSVLNINDSSSSTLIEKYQDWIDPHSLVPVEEQKKFIEKFNEQSEMCSYFLNSLKENALREYTGVDMNYNTEHIPTVVEGLKGIAQRYNTDLDALHKNY